MLEMSLEERALRHADDFFTGPEMWEHLDPTGQGRFGSLCVGRAICEYFVKAEVYDISIKDMLGVADVMVWNDKTCPSFAALKAKLAERILFYQNQRLKHSYLVVVGPGRKVGG